MKTFNKNKLWCIIVVILVITIVKENSNSDIYPTNANGQTYGLAETTAFEQLPDLLTAKGKKEVFVHSYKL